MNFRYVASCCEDKIPNLRSFEFNLKLTFEFDNFSEIMKLNKPSIPNGSVHFERN